jgi:peptidoglycan/xylan/chitin deacetylase (PgdA/CDA1 family)
MDTTLNAAPIVRRLHLKATVFMIGGAYRQAPVFYASPDQLRTLERDGWAIEAHAISGHGSVGVGNGHRLPYLSARRVSGGTLESLPSFTTRVAEDYRDARAAAERVAGAPVIAFSWPFGAYGSDHRTNDHRTAAINLRLARSQYALGFNDDGQETYTLAGRTGDPLRISRLRVDPTLTPRALFERIELAIAASGTIGPSDA